MQPDRGVNTLVSEEHTTPDRPPRFLSLALSLTVLLLVGVGAHATLSTIRGFTSQQRSHEIDSLRGEIVLLDEVLTMSARMCAVTGDQRWQERYKAAEPELARAINRALALATSDSAASAVAQTQEANRALLTMESNAFDLVRNGDLPKASALLGSSEYDSQKQRYATGMNLLADALNSEVQAAIAKGHQDAWARLAMLGSAIVILSVVWGAGASMSRTWRRKLLRSTEQVHHRAEELRQLNATLDHRVMERTTHLEAERRKAEATADALAQERSESARRSAQLEAILESMSEGVAVVDMRGRFLLINRAAEHALSLGALEVYPDESTEQYGLLRAHGATPCLTDDLPLARAVRGETVKNFVLVCGHEERSDGVHLDFNAAPVVDYGGSQIGAVATFRDVTEGVAAAAERATLQSQLVQAQKLEAIGQLAAGIAHEINTPTQYVGDNTHFLQDAFRDLLVPIEKCRVLVDSVHGSTLDDHAIRDLNKCIADADLEYLIDEIPNAIRQSLEGIDRVTMIVRAMKEFSHPSQDKALIDINRAIQSTITVSRNEWKYVAELDTHFDEALPLVPCLPGELNQVVLNMIVNAAHAIQDVVGESGEKGTLRIGTQDAGDSVEIQIADSGKGMPEDVREQIFDPFFTTKEVGRGTGQGLSIAHSVVTKKHGGTIVVESEPGKGTCFRIRLPKSDEASETVPS